MQKEYNKTKQSKKERNINQKSTCLAKKEKNWTNIEAQIHKIVFDLDLHISQIKRFNRLLCEFTVAVWNTLRWLAWLWCQPTLRRAILPFWYLASVSVVKYDLKNKEDEVKSKMFNSIIQPASKSNRIPNIERRYSCCCCLVFCQCGDFIRTRWDDDDEKPWKYLTQSLNIQSSQYNGIECRIRTDVNAIICDYCTLFHAIHSNPNQTIILISINRLGLFSTITTTTSKFKDGCQPITIYPKYPHPQFQNLKCYGYGYTIE